MEGACRKATVHHVQSSVSGTMSCASLRGAGQQPCFRGAGGYQGYQTFQIKEGLLSADEGTVTRT